MSAAVRGEVGSARALIVSPEDKRHDVQCSASQTCLLMAPFSLSQVSLDSRDKHFSVKLPGLGPLGKDKHRHNALRGLPKYPTASIQFTNELGNHMLGTGPWILRMKNQGKHPKKCVDRRLRTLSIAPAMCYPCS